MCCFGTRSQKITVHFIGMTVMLAYHDMKICAYNIHIYGDVAAPCDISCSTLLLFANLCRKERRQHTSKEDWNSQQLVTIVLPTYFGFKSTLNNQQLNYSTIAARLWFNAIRVSSLHRRTEYNISSFSKLRIILVDGWIDIIFKKFSRRIVFSPSNSIWSLCLQMLFNFHIVHRSDM